LCGLIFAVISFLMVSQVPTLSAKRLAIKRDYALYILVSVGLLTALIATFPWLVLTIVGLLYAASIPYGAWRYRKLLHAHAAARTTHDAAASDSETDDEPDEDAGPDDDADPDTPRGRSALH